VTIVAFFCAVFLLALVWSLALGRQLGVGYCCVTAYPLGWEHRRCGRRPCCWRSASPSASATSEPAPWGIGTISGSPLRPIKKELVNPAGNAAGPVGFLASWPKLYTVQWRGTQGGARFGGAAPPSGLARGRPGTTEPWRRGPRPALHPSSSGSSPGQGSSKKQSYTAIYENYQRRLYCYPEIWRCERNFPSADTNISKGIPFPRRIKGRMKFTTNSRRRRRERNSY
jgi:hypothetical protein